MRAYDSYADDSAGPSSMILHARLNCGKSPILRSASMEARLSAEDSRWRAAASRTAALHNRFTNWHTRLEILEVREQSWSRRLPHRWLFGPVPSGTLDIHTLPTTGHDLERSHELPTVHAMTAWLPAARTPVSTDPPNHRPTRGRRSSGTGAAQLPVSRPATVARTSRHRTK